MPACVTCQTPNNLQFDEEPLIMQRSQRQQTQIRKGPACTRDETLSSSGSINLLKLKHFFPKTSGSTKNKFFAWRIFMKLVKWSFLVIRLGILWNCETDFLQ